MLNEKAGVPVEDVKRIDADEMARALQSLPEAEREKLYYMIKGIELMGNKLAVGRAG